MPTPFLISSHKWFATGTAMQTLGLALILGGIFTLGALIAPVMFGTFPREDAGAVLTVVFRRFDMVVLICLGLIVVGELLRLWAHDVAFTMGVLAWIRYGLMGLLAVGIIISTQIIDPKIEAMHQAGIRPDATEQGLEFNRIHKQSEKLYKAEMVGALLILLLTPFIRIP